MVLGLGIGFALERLAGVPGGAIWGLIAGLIGAQFVPSRGGCAVTPPGDG